MSSSTLAMNKHQSIHCKRRLNEQKLSNKATSRSVLQHDTAYSTVRLASTKRGQTDNASLSQKNAPPPK